MEKQDWKLDAKAHSKAGFYKRRILIVQENFKLFSVLFGVFSLIMLPLDIANACTGGVAVWLAVLLNVIWVILAAALAAYVLFGSRKKREYFEKIGQIAYGGFSEEYALFSVEEAPAPLKKGERVRLYEERERYAIVCDGLDACGMKFWTKYDFRRDFGRMILDKADFKADGTDEVRLVGKNTEIRLKREERS